MKNIKKQLNQITNLITNNNKNNKPNNNNNKSKNIKNRLTKINKRINNITRQNRFRNRNRMPAANTKTLNRDFRILYQDGNTVKVTGRDLVYQIPSDITSTYNSDIITVIPANPCYWLGTRIAALAQGYQNYRPLNMKFNYIPQCAVTQQGNVIAGTLWNQAPSNVNLQQSLRTSNGGQLSQCYKPFTSVVRMKTNLQYNLYKTAGQFDQESNPFIYIAMAVGCLNENKQNIIPGYFYVTWSFVLKNPIGNSNIFYNSGLQLYQDGSSDYDNSTLIFLNANESELPRGAILQLEKDENGDDVATYNGSYYDLQGDDLVWQFSNSTIQSATAPVEPVKFNYYYTSKIQGPYQEQVIHQVALLETNDHYPDKYLIYSYTQAVARTLLRNTTYYILDAITSITDEGTFVGALVETNQELGMTAYLIDKQYVELVDVTNNKLKMDRKRKPQPKLPQNMSITKYLLAKTLDKPKKKQKLEEEYDIESLFN